MKFMIAEFSNGIINLWGHSKEEEYLLNEDYLKTKLAYQLKRIEDSDPNSLKIYTGAEKFKIDIKKKKAFISPKNLNRERLGYILRILLDSYILWNGGLPLHASAIKIADITVLFFGKSNSGKSTISYYLKKINSNISIIGDDHIVISEMKIFGNNKSRIRKFNNQNEFYFDNIQKESFSEKYFIFEVDINDKLEKIEFIDANNYLQNDISHI
jgi:serine kinase of HPr protein (carbohydrate metabolism regulator)